MPDPEPVEEQPVASPNVEPAPPAADQAGDLMAEINALKQRLALLELESRKKDDQTPPPPPPPVKRKPPPGFKPGVFKGR